MAALNVAFWRLGGLGPKAGSERTWVPFTDGIGQYGQAAGLPGPPARTGPGLA